MYSGCESQRPLSHLSGLSHIKNTPREWKMYSHYKKTAAIALLLPLLLLSLWRLEFLTQPLTAWRTKSKGPKGPRQLEVPSICMIVLKLHTVKMPNSKSMQINEVKVYWDSHPLSSKVGEGPGEPNIFGHSWIFWSFYSGAYFTFIQSNMSLIKSLRSYNRTTSRGCWLNFLSKFGLFFDQIFLCYLTLKGLFTIFFFYRSNLIFWIVWYSWFWPEGSVNGARDLDSRRHRFESRSPAPRVEVPCGTASRGP